MNLMPLLSFHLTAHQLRKTNQNGWFYATGIWSITDDKASFDTIDPI